MNLCWWCFSVPCNHFCSRLCRLWTADNYLYSLTCKHMIISWKKSPTLPDNSLRLLGRAGKLLQVLYSGKLLRVKTFMNFTVWEPPVNVFSTKFWACHTHLWLHGLVFRESFLRKIFTSNQSAKVFYLESFPPYGTWESSSTVICLGLPMLAEYALNTRVLMESSICLKFSILVILPLNFYSVVEAHYQYLSKYNLDNIHFSQTLLCVYP